MMGMDRACGRMWFGIVVSSEIRLGHASVAKKQDSIRLANPDHHHISFKLYKCQSVINPIYFSDRMDLK
jgi:hypothetical protein